MHFLHIFYCNSLLGIIHTQWSRQIVVEVNPLCGQRRSLLAQMGSSNNQTTLTRRVLITNQRPMMRVYLDSNASTCRRVVAPVPLLRLVTIPMILMNGHLHMQRTTQTQA